MTGRHARALKRFLGLSTGLTVLLSGVVLAAPIAVPAAHATPACTDSWVNPAGGDWTAPNNWSLDAVPGSSDVACITLTGTYTVEITAIDVAEQVSGFTIGGAASGIQTLQVDSAATMSVSSAATDFAGGAISNNGAFNAPNEFVQDAGTTTGNPINLVNTTLDITGNGQSAFNMSGSTEILGSIAADQTVNLTSGSIYFGNVATNAGTITVAGTGSTLTAGGGTLTNTGLIQANSGDTGALTLSGSFDNQGSGANGIIADSNITNQGPLTNEGAITIGTGATWTADAAITTTGTIANSGTINVPNESFSQGAGATSGNPVNIQGGFLDFTGSGQSAFDLTGTPQINGSVAATQSIAVTSASVYFGTVATNAGTITVAGTGSTLTAGGGTLTNTGLIQANSGDTGALTLSGSFDNQGSGANGIIADSNITNQGPLTNEGAITIGAGATWTAAGAITTTGTIANSGTINVPANESFSQGAGATSGNPVNIQGGFLTFTGAGESAFALTGGPEIFGSIAADQTLTLTSTTQNPASIYFANTATNAGSITVSGTGSTLTAGAGTVTNTGTIDNAAASGPLVLAGSWDNQASSPGGIIADSSINETGPLANNGSISIGTAATWTDTFIFTNNAGTIANAGVFSDTNEFIENAGATTGNPINVSGVNGDLEFDGAGPSSFTATGPDEIGVHGDVSAGQTLTLLPGSSIFTYAQPFINNGVVDAASTTAGTTIVGSVDNAGTFIAESGNPTTIDGSYSQESTGTTKVDLGDPVNYGRIAVASTTSLAGQLVTSTSFNPGGSGFTIINSTGALSGNFSTYAFGSQPFGLSYTANTVQLNGASGLAVTTSLLPTAQVGNSYSATLTTSGASGGVTWAVTSGGLPFGLTMSSAGVISGTPTLAGTIPFTVTATDSSTPTAQVASALVSITVTGAGLVVTTTSLPGGEATNPYPDTTLTSTGGSAPITWAVTNGKLPAGLALNPSTGTISGTPTAGGTTSFAVVATDSTGPKAETAKSNLSITVTPALAVKTATLPGGQVGSAYSGATLVSTGGTAPITWAVTTGTLPAGLSLDPATGAITGTPTGAGAVDTFTVAATDSTTPLAQTATADLSIKITSVTLTIIPTGALPSGLIGVPYVGASLASTGGTAPVMWKVTTGKLPAGLTLDPNTAAISGTPTAAGNKSFTITATDSSSPKVETATVTLSITVAAGLSVTPKTLPAGQVGTAYPGATLASNGGTAPLTWAVTTGALPAGLSLNAATGAITGTPDGPGAPSSFTVTATDSSAPVPLTANANLSISIVSQPLAVTTTALPGGQVGAAYPGATLTSTGGTAPITWAVTTGTLPTGLSLNPATGAITGTPTAAGKVNVTLTATDSTRPTNLTAKATLSITVIAALVVTTSALPAGLINTAYSAATLAASGGTAPITWAVTTGKLPAGLTLNGSSGTISGTPTVSATTSFTVTATDSSAPAALTAKAKLSITVNGPTLAVTTASLPAGLVNSTYAGATLSSTGGNAPVTWAVTTGSLPAGLSLDANSGAITGTPTGPGAVSSFTVTATDSSTPTAETATANLSITVTSPALAVTTTSLPSGAVGVAYAAPSFASSGGSAPITWAVTTGKLPAGLVLSSAGAITGTPTVAGITTFTVTATDSTTPTHLTAKVSVSITVVAALTLKAVPTPAVGQTGIAYPGISPGSTGGTAPINWGVSAGALPPGLVINPATGAITGTPNQVGVYPFTLTATDSASPTPATASVNLSISVQGPPLVITTTSLPSGVAGTSAYGAFIATSGGSGTITYAVTAGALPPGLTLNNAGFILGTLPAKAAVYQFTVTATDSSTPALTAKAVLSIAVIGVLGITTNATLPNAQVGLPYSATLATTGGTAPITWSLSSGPLPDGLSFNPTTGAITGTPTTAGHTSFRMVATDSGLPNPQFAVILLGVTVSPLGLQITTGPPPAMIQGQPVSWQMTATGGVAPYTWSSAAGLAGGLTLNPTTGLVTGTPTVHAPILSYIKVTDATGASATTFEYYNIAAPAAPLALGSVVRQSLTLGQPYYLAMNATGGVLPYTFSVTGGPTLPPGLTLNPTTGVISGTPNQETGNVFLDITVTDSANPAATATTFVDFSEQLSG